MESLTPFIRRQLEDAPGPSGPPEAAGSRVSPALGSPPEQPPVTKPPKPGCGSQQSPSQPDGPDVQLPPESEQPGVPMTNGTPVACRQKNAAEYLAGRSPGVMTQYGQGLFGPQQHTKSPHPAPEEDESGVLQLVEWREEAPYG